MPENDIKDEVLDTEKTPLLSIEDLNTLIEQKYLDKFKRLPETTGLSLPISIVRNLDLNDEDFYNYLDVITSNDYDKLINAIVIDYDLTSKEVMELLKRYPSHITRIPIGFINRFYSDFIEFIIKYQELFTMEMLPKAIMDDKRIINTFVQAEPQEHEDEKKEVSFEELAEEYLNSQMSLTNFCIKKGIPKIYHFRKIIQEIKNEKFGSKDDHVYSLGIERKRSTERSNHKKRARKIGVNKLRDIATKIANGEITLEDYLRDYYHPFITIYSLAATLEGDELNKFNNTMASQLMKYIIVDHPIDLDADKIADLFDYDHEYIVNQDSITQSKLGNDVETYIRNYSPRYDHMITERLIRNVNASLKPWTDHYGTQTIQYQLDDKGKKLSPVFTITDELIDDVVNYLVENNIYVCFKSVRLYLRKALLGEITLKEEPVEPSEEPTEVELIKGK